MRIELTKIAVADHFSATVEPSVSCGDEKTVFSMWDGGSLIAAKIYHSSRNGIPINRSERAVAEFEEYLLFRQTALGIFVPEPRCLLYDNNGEVIGLGVQWVEGTDLDEVYPQQLLNSDTVDRLEHAVFSCIDAGVIPEGDMLSSWNLLYCPDTEQKLYLAECMVDTECSRESAQRNFADTLREMRNHFIAE